MSILDLLNEESRERPSVGDPYIPEKLPVTRGVLNNASKMCEAVREIGKGSFEWYGILTASRSDEKFVANNFVVPEKVAVWPGNLYVTGDQRSNALAQIEQDNEINGTDNLDIGWIHSHGRGGVGFSAEDQRNLDKLMKTLRLNTQQRKILDLDIFDGDTFAQEKDGDIIVAGYDIVDGAVKLKIRDDEEFEEFLMDHNILGNNKGRFNKAEFLEDLVDHFDFSAYRSNIIGFGYSIVVNENDDTYALVSTVEEDPLVKRMSPVKSTKVELEIIEDTDCELSYDEIEAMVEERLEFQNYQTKKFKGSGAVKAPQFRVGNKAYTPSQGGSNYVPGNYGSVYTGNQYNTPSNTVVAPDPEKKTRAPQNLNIPKAFANAFASNIFSYVSFYGLDYCNYTEYMDDLGCVLSNYQFKGGIEEAVNILGPLYEDSLDNYAISKMKSHMIEHVATKIMTPAYRNDKIDLEFMSQFINAQVTTEQDYPKDRVIEFFIPKYLGE